MGLQTLGALKIRSSFTIRAGCVDEITWTQEEMIIRLLKEDQKGYDHALDYRVRLRRAAMMGLILYRRHPEHGWWEYGPQWRRKDFGTLLDAAESADRLGGGAPR